MTARVIRQGKRQKQLFLVYIIYNQNMHWTKVNHHTNLGIRTPGLHSISSSPKYSVPNIYCKGSPLARRLTYCCNRLFSSLRPFLEATSAACSPSHLSSFCDEGKSRHTGSRDGNRRFRRLASRRKVGGMRGMRSRSPPERGK